MSEEKSEKYSETQFYKDRVRTRKVASKAIAFIERGKTAGIPVKHLRTSQEAYKALLYDKFYGNVKALNDVVDKTYTNPDKLFDTPFVTIDGGDVASRKLAGYTIMFRVILRDKWAHHIQCSHLFSLFQAGFSKANERASVISSLKKHDILFISEVNQSIFDPRIMVGTFFDEILDSRSDQNKVTVISFSNPINSKSTLDSECGDYLSNLSSSEQSNSNVCRIRVRKSNV